MKKFYNQVLQDLFPLWKTMMAMYSRVWGVVIKSIMCNGNSVSVSSSLYPLLGNQRKKYQMCIKTSSLLHSLSIKIRLRAVALAIGLAYHPHSLQTSGPIGPWPPPPTWSAWSSISCRSLSPPPWKLFLSLWSGSCDTAATDMCGQWALNNVPV